MTYHRPTGQKHGGTPTSSDSWFISFGDLLTLLVCFFLLLTPQARTASANNKLNHWDNSGLTMELDTGTDFAPRDRDLAQNVTTGDVVTVWKHNLQGQGTGHGQQPGAEHWSRELRRRIAAGAVATVRLCRAEVERDVIAGVLSESGGSKALASRVQFEIGAECDAWRAHAVSPDELVAVVHFSER